MKNGTENKLKFKQLQRRLDLPLWQARGLLDTLWNFVATNCPAGDLGKFTDEEIATGIDWRGDAQELIQAFQDARWVDSNPDPRVRLMVHDWPEHCEDTVHKALARRVDLFANGRMPNLSRFEKKERPQILRLYELKYGKDVVQRGGKPPDAQERPETPQNAPAKPSLAKPSLAIPRPSIPAPTPEIDQIDPVADANEAFDDCAEYGGTDGRTDEFSSNGWGRVARKLGKLRAARGADAIRVAKDQGATAAEAEATIDYGIANGFDVKAIVCRLKLAHAHMPPDAGWPTTPPKDQVARQAKAAKLTDRQKSENDALATAAIKQGRRDKLPDEEITKRLEAAGLEWPK